MQEKHLAQCQRHSVINECQILLSLIDSLSLVRFESFWSDNSIGLLQGRLGYQETGIGSNWASSQVSSTLWSSTSTTIIITVHMCANHVKFLNPHISSGSLVFILICPHSSKVKTEAYRGCGFSKIKIPWFLYIVQINKSICHLLLLGSGHHLSCKFSERIRPKWKKSKNYRNWLYVYLMNGSQ